MADEILISYRVEVDQLKAELKQVQSQLKATENTGKDAAKQTSKEFNKAGNDIKQTLGSIAGAIGIAFGVNQVISFGKESIKAFAEAEVNANKLKFAVTQIGKEGGAAFQKLIDQSNKLQSISIFSDDDIQKAQTQLATLGLNSKQIEDLIPKVLDLASATGQDLGSATDSIIQGINGQTRSLRAVGLEFTATGDKTKNLSILSENLTKFQGSTAAALETTAGKAARLGNAYDNLKESVGEYLVGVGNELLNSFDILTGKTTIAQNASQKLGDVLIQNAKKLSDKRLAIAGQSEANRLTQIKATELSIDALEKQRIATSNINTKAIFDRKLKQQKEFLNDLKKLNQTGGDLSTPVDPAAAQKAKEDADKLAKELLEKQKGFEDKSIADSKDAFKKKSDTILDEGKRLNKELADADKQAESDALKAEQDAANESIRIAKEKQDGINAVKQAGFNTAVNIINSLSSIQQQKVASELEGIQEVYDREGEALDSQLKRRLITQSQYDFKKAELDKKQQTEEYKLKKKAFLLQKELSIINILISTAEAVAKANSAAIPPYNYILMALAAANGAAQVAVVASQPTPKFAKGGKVDGRLHTQGGTLIEAERDEWIIKRNESIKNDSLLDAINKGKGQKYIYEMYVAPALKEQLKKHNTSKDSSFASNIASSMMLNSDKLNDGNILESLKMQRQSDRDNVDRLIKEISKQQYNPRNIV